MAARTVSTARSCHGLAERNVRLYLSGAITEQRLEELSHDLARTCPLAACYESWLFQHRHELPIGRQGPQEDEKGKT